MALPANFYQYGNSQDGNRQELQRTTSTTDVPKVMIIDRQRSAYDAGRGKYSVQRYRVRITTGTKNAEGIPQPEKVSIDVTFSIPVGSEAAFDVAYADFAALIATAGFPALVKANNLLS